ncbi:MAG: tRNA modification GTPase MnmE [Lentisphaerae bacterium ADurb.Bin242]|nr:MAG: tRNA modification GTPase MnmE [Lentisphaerae bacterium ADurb.Bin242]
MQKKFCFSLPAEETVCALCTAPGGALAILRISGPDALETGNAVWRGHVPLSRENARKMLLGKLYSGDPSSPGEPCLAVFMPGPKSYTGEDTVELHCHGGSFAPKRLLEAVLASGIRLAAPGEFTKRAFLNGKMDLTQAEAVADLISAKSESAARLAEKQLSGRIGSQVRQARERLIHLLAEIESRMDFPEEELDWMAPSGMTAELQRVAESLRKMLQSVEHGSILRNGLRVVIAGRPNAGKSSLLNALLGFERAIVTEIPGTTRDTLEEFVSLRGIPVMLTDTAGLREQSADPIEKLGIRRSRDSMRTAQFIFWVLDASTSEAAAESAEHLKTHLPFPAEAIVAWNKTELDTSPEVLPELSGLPCVRISALKGDGLDALLDLFAARVWKGNDVSESECEVSARHAAFLEDALSSLEKAVPEIASESWELAAACMRGALAALGSITGEEVSPDMLDEIFSRFCIGK